MANIERTHGFEFYATDIEVNSSNFILSANNNGVGVNIHMEELDIVLSFIDIQSLIEELTQLIHNE